MTTQAERDTQTQTARDVFEAYAEQISQYFGRDTRPSDIESLVDSLLAADVLASIHAERRRRLSAATREGRK